jgi:Na+-translocating ferredoxin:NAD+ oxidoreductase RnfG subunit
VVVITTSLLTLTDSFTMVEIEAQQDQQTLEMIQVIFPKASSYVLEEESEIYKIYDNEKNEIGYAFLAAGKGYLSLITILVGLEDKEMIKGITIISHGETSWVPVGEGEEHGSLDFTVFSKQFIGLKIEDCKLKKNGGRLDIITMATTSSEAVVNAVREVALEKVKSIK